MAVTTTGQDVHNGALAKSSKNEPSKFAAPEIIRRINKRLSGIYQVAARVNPILFAAKSVVVETTGMWVRPEVALSVEMAEDTTPDPVEIVPFDDQQSEAHQLCVYEFGQTFYAITTAAGTPTGDLTFWYARRPTTITALANTLDAQWREDYNELLELELAIDYSLKDGRTDEAAALIADRNTWLMSFMQFAQHLTGGERRRFERKTVNIQELLPLLAGGAT
ncbi:MAG: hypothetical protein OEO20_11250 [Gemmatimonadota bacterium]|nr:hypothetical protein [Gemmatimonadota bacterium]MDH3368925.1 hypothetical protein [Gemmatimonadota bacterium]MDH3478869.1 hypothetical protein [Gemmatimonadota bacterium]MDH3570299.1 hypothetical protein [Gemmatimonadota bacterium]